MILSLIIIIKIKNTYIYSSLINSYRYKALKIFSDHIGPRLWQALHVGSVPIYFGSPTIGRWIPNQMSVIRVSEFKTPESLAGHVEMLVKNLEKYSSYLQHKPSYNSNYFTLVSNKGLEEFNLNLKYKQTFECLVCERVSKNEKIIKIGFKGYPYHSNENKLKCPGINRVIFSYSCYVFDITV